VKRFADLIIEVGQAAAPAQDNDRPITENELRHIEKYLDSVWKHLGVEFEFTKHFFDRVNDSRNRKQITAQELVKIFTEAYKRYGKMIAGKVTPEKENSFDTVLTDLSTKVNSPVVVVWDKQAKELKMVAKTVMRVNHFYTHPDQSRLTVEEKGWMSPKGKAFEVTKEHSEELHPAIEKKVKAELVKFPKTTSLKIEAAQRKGYARYGTSHDGSVYIHFDENAPGGTNAALHALRHLKPKFGDGIYITHKPGLNVEMRDEKIFDSPGKAAEHIRSFDESINTVESTPHMNKTKSFTDLREWLGWNTPEVAPIAAPQAVDDVDTAAFSVEQPDVLDKLNGYCHGIANHQYINPYYPLNALWQKLSIIGLNFDPKKILLTGEQGRVTVPLTQFGGRYGILGGPELVSQDDGISNRIPGGLELVVAHQKTGGVYTLNVEIQHGSGAVGFGEEVVAEEVRCPLCGQDNKKGQPCNCHTPTPTGAKQHGVANQPALKKK